LKNTKNHKHDLKCFSFTKLLDCFVNFEQFYSVLLNFAQFCSILLNCAQLCSILINFGSILLVARPFPFHSGTVTVFHFFLQQFGFLFEQFDIFLRFFPLFFQSGNFENIIFTNITTFFDI